MNPFLWLAGADRATLRGCGSVRRSETTRLSALGALVLVPAVLGLVSMSYAVSTVAPQREIYLAAGACWALIVLAIDRYLVVSTRKMPLTGRGRSVSAAIVARYVFAVFVGIAVAHPFSLLWFDDSIVQQLNTDQGAAVSARLDQARADRENVQRTVPPAQSPGLLDHRQQLVDYKNCLTSLQQFEQSNAPVVQLPCGATTGVPTCARRCQDISPRIDAAGRDIEQLDTQIAAARSTEAADAARVAPFLAEIDKRETEDVERLRGTFSFDYLARVDALDEIDARNPQVRVISTFIVIFFVLVDVLPVTMKMSARAGEYDHVQETQLLRVAAYQKAVQDQMGWAEQERAASAVAADLKEAYATVIADLSTNFFTSYSERKTAFGKALAAFRARPGAGSGDEELQLKNIQAIDDTAWDKAMKRIMDHLDTL